MPACKVILDILNSAPCELLARHYRELAEAVPALPPPICHWSPGGDVAQIVWMARGRNLAVQVSGWAITDAYFEEGATSEHVGGYRSAIAYATGRLGEMFPARR